MGYTHYWEMSSRVKELPSELVRDVKNVVESYADVLDDYTVDKGVLVFNGIGEAGHETFYVEASDNGFCKTNGKPYDKAVCESLLVLKHHLGEDFKLESDGFYVGRDDFDNDNLNGNWIEALENVKEKFGYEFQLDPKVEQSGQHIYYSFDISSTKEMLEKEFDSKKEHLLFDKCVELGVDVVDEQYSENGDLHVLCERESDGSHIVWTSHHTGEVETSYVDFYNGKYDMNLEEGFRELDRRSGRGQEKLGGIYAFDENGKPSMIASDLEKFLDNAVSDSRFEQFVKDGTNYHVEDLVRWQEGSDVVSDMEFEEDMKELLAEYGVLLNPTREELGNLIEQYGLSRRHENVEGLFKQESVVDKQIKHMARQVSERE